MTNDLVKRGNIRQGLFVARSVLKEALKTRVRRVLNTPLSVFTTLCAWPNWPVCRFSPVKVTCRRLPVLQHRKPLS